MLDTTDKKKYMAFTFIMQNIAANLGGMLTPFGNPQNLYLYTKFNIPNLEFTKIMAPPFVISIILITLCCIIFVKPEPLKIEGEKVNLLFSVASCQVISNVPSAILLSQFTDNYADLLVGVNIGGAGTLIASLASLITYREYTKHCPEKTVNYIKQFTAFNFGILAILVIFMILI